MNRASKWAAGLSLVAVCALVAWWQWSTLLNQVLPADQRPAAIEFPIEALSLDEFERTADALRRHYRQRFSHVRRFRDAGILAYEGPETCLACHQTMTVRDPETKAVQELDTLESLLGSVHYRFFSKGHDNVFGMDGRSTEGIPMGKINRMCPKPGSAAMTAWAEVVKLDDGRELSEGCGQCHIGGQYQGPMAELLPGYRTTRVEQEAIDCLICHSVAYDMNRKQVVVDDNGRRRWDQDRSMRAAMAVTRPDSQACLRCHQHNMGGDIYIDEADPSFMESLQNIGDERPRVLHPGSKRGTPFSPSWDVHAAAGMQCLDCHVALGHRVPKGRNTTSLVANDLPARTISCEGCHGEQPHAQNAEVAPLLNMHHEKVACQTCHIPSLHEDNATYRDFVHPIFEKHAGIYIYDDVLKATSGRDRGIMYVWWNGSGTMVSNPIGDNPNGEGLYRFYDPDQIWPEFEDFDYEAWYQETMRPLIAEGGPSKLYPMKRFNGHQHADLVNAGPFAGMFLPYNLPTYYATGDAEAAVREEVRRPMIRMMYGNLFKYFLLDRFMSCIKVDHWDPGVYPDVLELKNVAPRWMPMDAGLEINHAIRRQGLSCRDCHSADGVLDWKALGYPEDQVETLQSLADEVTINGWGERRPSGP
ncbi:cytochrome c3 family protein [Thioalkalivibrio sp.]|uniref:cytochrome c3 family protein n=1 Tax=Thioalkalivibrio sp. TaxID=2093813 RepID=UPI0039752A8A